MNSVSAKTITICKKQTAPNLPKNSSLCSCDKCDSYRCFGIRNMTSCSCEKCSKTGYEVSQTINFESKSSSKTSKLDEPESFKKEINYDDSKENLEKASVQQTVKSKGLNPDTAKLSAQIMNVPFSDFKQSVSYNNDISRRSPKLTKTDIFRRIKDAYKACSCKVCECIIGKTNCNDICKCKPCQCIDCVAAMNNLKYVSNFHLSGQGYGSAQCDGKQCKSFVKRSLSYSQYCDCVPCDCLKCFNTYNEPCNCKPCECIECKAFSVPKPKPKALIVGRVREDVPRAHCSCSPCECDACDMRFPMASTLRRDISTGISRPPNCNCETCSSPSCETSDNDRCSCQIQKQVMRKPFEKDSRDFDIHLAAIDKRRLVDKRNRNPIAMFAAVKNTSPKLNFLSKECDCGDCECLVCNRKDKIDIDKMIRNEDSCNCLPCECEVCKKCNIRSTVRIPKPCTCDICNCLECDGYINMTQARQKQNSVKVIKTYSTRQCKCRPCECADCQHFMCNSENNYHQSYSKTSCNQENRDETFFESNDTCSLNKVNSHSKLLYNNEDIEQPSASYYSSCRNRDRQEASRRIKYIKGSDYSVVKPEQDLHRNSLMCDMYKQCTEKFIPQYDSNFYNSVDPKHGNLKTSKYCSDEFSVSFQNNLTKPQGHDHIISSYTSRQSLQGSVDKYINFKTKLNLQEDLNSINNNATNKGCSKDIENHEINNEKINHLEPSSKHIETKTIKDVNKSTNQLEDNQSQILSVKKISQDLVDSLRYANDKFSRLKYAKMQNKTVPDKLQENEIKETTSPEKCIPDKIEDFTSNDQIIDFDKVKHSLQQAKAFSIELIKLLQQYQKANYDYHKYSNLEFLKRPKYDFDCKTKDQKENFDTYTSFRVETQNTLRMKDNANRKVLKDKIEMETEMYSKSGNDNLPSTSNKTNLIDYLLSDHESHDFGFPLSQSNAMDKDHSKDFSFNNDNMKKVNLPYSRQKTGQNFNSLLESKSCSQNKITINSNSDSKQILAASTSTTLDESQNNHRQLKLKETFGAEDERGWSILKKNFILYTPSSTRKKVDKKPNLILEAWPVDQYSRNEYAPCGNNPEVNNSERTLMQKGLQLAKNLVPEATQTFQIMLMEKGVNCVGPVTVPTDHKEQEHAWWKLDTGAVSRPGAKKCAERTGSSSEHLKVKIMSLKSVSDHTVFVKWKQPQDMNNVEGYEVLVDGRAVQTILCLSRCMAFISSLPDQEQVLITIRTIVDSAKYREHIPSANIVYRPRNNS